MRALGTLRVVAGTTVGIILLFPTGLVGQKAAPPANVTVQLVANAVTIGWTAMNKGLTYHVYRSTDMKSPGVEIVKPAYNITSVVDASAAPGTTYFYQVVAEATDGSASADPVQFTVPALVMASMPRGAAMSQPLTVAPGGLQSRNPLATPTAVTGIIVNGTTASATVSWRPVTGAVSYSVTRIMPGGGSVPTPVTGILTPSWTDTGPLGGGFTQAGTYQYVVAAVLSGGSSVSGQAAWTRPSPTCAPPTSAQVMLAFLNPLTNSQFTWKGVPPSGAVFSWYNRQNAIAYRMERSVQGTNTWTLLATSCGGTFPLAASTGVAGFIDHLGGVLPGVTYLYKLTAFAPTGDYGEGTVVWPAPNPFVVRWLQASAAATATTGTNVTLQWRYESPATNAPSQPTAFLVTTDYGFSKTWLTSCAAAAGCTELLTQVPPGPHKFTVTARWGIAIANIPPANALPMVPAQITDTVIVVP